MIKKWKNMRTHFGDEKRKIKGLKSGMSCDDVYESKWKWFQAMSFMDDHVNVKAKTTLSNFILQVSSFILFYGHSFINVANEMFAIILTNKIMKSRINAEQ